MPTELLRGVIPPMITPFDDSDRIDSELMAVEARFLQRCGVSGLVVAGSTGEGAGMTPEEVAECVRIVRTATEDRIPVLAGVIADTTREAAAVGRAAATAGAWGLQVPPPAFRTTVDVRVLSAYYRSIADNVGLPLIIYNVIPWAQVAGRALEEMRAGNPLIVGVKQSARNFHALTDLLANRVDGLGIYSAIDDMLYPSFMLGVDGTISGTASVFPVETIDLLRAVETHRFADALRIHNSIAPVWRVLDKPDFPARIKYAMAVMGRACGRPRRPLSWPAPDVATSIVDALQRSGIVRDPVSSLPARVTQ